MGLVDEDQATRRLIGPLDAAVLDDQIPRDRVLLRASNLEDSPTAGLTELGECEEAVPERDLVLVLVEPDDHGILDAGVARKPTAPEELARIGVCRPGRTSQVV